MQQLRKEFQQAKTILQLVLERELLAEVIHFPETDSMNYRFFKFHYVSIRL